MNGQRQSRSLRLAACVVGSLAMCAGTLASVRESRSFNNVGSIGTAGSPGNAIVSADLAGGYQTRLIRVSGTLAPVVGGTYPSDARIVVIAPDGSIHDLGELSDEYEFDGAVFIDTEIVIEPSASTAGRWWFEFYESTDNGSGPDAVWQNVTLAFDDGVCPPPAATDLGSVIPGGASRTGVPLSPTQELWYTFTLSRPVDVGVGDFLEISTAGSNISHPDESEYPNDTVLGLFTATGQRVAENDDASLGSDFTSLLSFGDGSGGAGTGEHGRLDPGVYYLAVCAYGSFDTSCFGFESDSDQSGTVNLTITTNLAECEPPQIVSGPASRTTDQGGTATFEVTATGAGTLAYQWQHNGRDLVDEGSHINGSQTRVLVISNARTTDAGRYTVLVSNGCEAEASATLDVRCLADFNRDGFVTGDDFDAYVAEFTAGNPPADFNGDGFVTGDDFDEFVRAYSVGDCERCPESPRMDPASDLGQHSAVVHWQSNAAGVTGFQIDLSENGTDFTEYGTAAADARSLQLTGLAEDRRYWARIQACGSACCSDESNVVEFSTTTAPPAAPSHVTTPEIWDTAVDVHWRDHSVNESGFQVEKFDGGAWVGIGTAPANTTKLRIRNGLASSTTYPIRVSAFNSGGAASSSAINVRTGPARPINIRVTDINPYDAIVRWDDVSSDESKFVIWLDRWTGADWTRERTIDNPANDNGRHLSPPDLAQGTRYRVTVRAHRNDGTRSGISNWAEFTTTLDVPNQPTNFRASDVWDTAIDLAWADNSNNEGGVHIQRLIGPSWHTIAARGANATSARLEAPEFAIVPSTDYDFRVVAFNNNGNSQPSNEIHIRSGPACPTNVRVANRHRLFADIAWQDNAIDEDRQEVFWERWNGTAWVEKGSRETTVNDTALRIPDPNGTFRFTPNTLYRAYVRSYRNDGSRSGICEYREFTTLP